MVGKVVKAIKQQDPKFLKVDTIEAIHRSGGDNRLRTKTVSSKIVAIIADPCSQTLNKTSSAEKQHACQNALTEYMRPLRKLCPVSDYKFAALRVRYR